MAKISETLQSTSRWLATRPARTAERTARRRPRDARRCGACRGRRTSPERRGRGWAMVKAGADYRRWWGMRGQSKRGGVARRRGERVVGWRLGKGAGASDEGVVRVGVLGES
eukprot:scaffold31072_cov60-Phaeocystis_antarctica.AAC.3